MKTTVEIEAEEQRKEQGGFKVFVRLFSSNEMDSILRTSSLLGFKYKVNLINSIDLIEGLIFLEDVQAFFELAEVEI